MTYKHKGDLIAPAVTSQAVHGDEIDAVQIGVNTSCPVIGPLIDDSMAP